ncbi:MAG: serine/threonine protein kinase [Candidatus Riflebacteria bacterium]|nr:serine/threonine protein kinase [Candidatus Riflebacteria bacterium]
MSFVEPPDGPGLPDALRARYRSPSCLGTGATSSVFRAWDSDLDRPVVVKVLRRSADADPELDRRFLREAKILAALKHPRIIGILDHGVESGRAYLVYPWEEGTSADNVLGSRGPLAPGWCLKLGLELLEGLSVVHGAGIVHRDLKPGNVLLRADGSQIMDFGLARPLDRSTLTTPGTFVGTFVYAAPEQILLQPVDPRDDLYALGVILYEACTGQLPFGREESLAQFVHRQLNEMPEPPSRLVSHLPTALSVLIMKLLAKQREDRPVSARQALSQLRSIGGIVMPDRLLPAAGHVGPAEPPGLTRTAGPSTAVVPAREARTLAGDAVPMAPRPGAARNRFERHRLLVCTVVALLGASILGATLRPARTVSADPKRSPSTRVATAPAPEPLNFRFELGADLRPVGIRFETDRDVLSRIRWEPGRPGTDGPWQGPTRSHRLELKEVEPEGGLGGRMFRVAFKSGDGVETASRAYPGQPLASLFSTLFERSWRSDLYRKMAGGAGARNSGRLDPDALRRWLVSLELQPTLETLTWTSEDLLRVGWTSTARQADAVSFHLFELAEKLSGAAWQARRAGHALPALLDGVERLAPTTPSSPVRPPTRTIEVLGAPVVLDWTSLIPPGLPSARDRGELVRTVPGPLPEPSGRWVVAARLSGDSWVGVSVTSGPRAKKSGPTRLRQELCLYPDPAVPDRTVAVEVPLCPCLRALPSLAFTLKLGSSREANRLSRVRLESLRLVDRTERPDGVR